MLNAAGVFWGGAELGIQRLRQINNGPRQLARAIGYGTQRTAAALRGMLSFVSKVGRVLGNARMLLSTVSYGSQLITNSDNISTATHVNFWVGAGLYGAAAVIGGPIVGGAALIYGIAEMGSYLYNGNTLEENIIGKQ